VAKITTGVVEAKKSWFNRTNPTLKLLSGENFPNPVEIGSKWCMGKWGLKVIFWFCDSES